MKLKYLLGLILGVLCLPVKASIKQTEVYVPIQKEFISVKASSEFKGFPAIETINGSGMVNNYHRSHNLGNMMWISTPSTQLVSATEDTQKGVVWLVYSFDKPRTVDLLEIWNHNQSDHTNRGLQKVYLQYSNDGTIWNTLKDGNRDYFILPESKGRKLEPADFSLNLKGLTFKYFVITADKEQGNYYHDGNEKTLQDAKHGNQNIDYYGLSEVRFYELKRCQIDALPHIDDFRFKASQAYVHSLEGPCREFTIEYEKPVYAGGKLFLECNGKKKTIEIPKSKSGITTYTSTFMAGMMENNTDVKLKFISAQGTCEKIFNVAGARKWTVYFLPHSHLDIGYTHRHEDVLALQWRNLERAMDLAEATKCYPQGAQFHWNSETMWCVTEYLKKYQGTSKAERLKKAIKEGVIGLDASLASMLTGICKQEEMTHLFDDAYGLEKELGIDINTAMMSDVPGASWGTVTAMAQNGVKYFSMAPNYVPFYPPVGGSRVGNVHREWGDFPFYWESASGKERIMFWSAGKGYSFFHSWLTDKLSACGTEPIWEYLTELENKPYPYDIAYLRYTIQGDNGPPDDLMPEIIKEWNQRYDYPQFIIGTTKQLFEDFESKYANCLPVLKGDMTPYWEDGAASTAKELAMNRQSSDRLNQSEILWSLLDRKSYPEGTFKEGWRNVILFSEHTWGASASGPDPESDFTKLLWKQKSDFAVKGDSLSSLVYKGALKTLQSSKQTDETFVQVINTQSWMRSDVVFLISKKDLSQNVLVDEQGKQIPLQKVEGENKWAFIALDIPPLGSKVYTLKPIGKKMFSGKLFSFEKDTLKSDVLTLAVDRKYGTISSLKIKGNDWNYAGENGLNQYFYSSRNAGNLQTAEVNTVELIQNGPVFATVRILSNAPGCNFLTQDITVYAGLDKVDIVNTLDKKKDYKYENIRFGFPFNIENPQLRVDLPFEEMGPEREQLAGANKNFYSVNNGVAVEGMKHGIFLSLLDTPIMETGEMTGEAWLKDSKEFLEWSNSAKLSPVIYSWVMNNSWRTNYKASQEGVCSLRYTIVPFDPDVRDFKKKGIEISQHLVASYSSKNESLASLFKLQGKHHIAISTIRPCDNGKSLLVRLNNTSRLVAHAAFEWGGIQPKRIFECDNEGKFRQKFSPSSFYMKPFETLTLKLELE